MTCVVLDLSLPNGGLDVFCRKLREKNPGVPIVVSEGKGHDASLDELIDVDNCSVLMKPFRYEQFCNLILKKARLRPLAA